MLETIISEYLVENRRLVIPVLGAFLKKDSGETVFVPFLNKDDGVFTDLIKNNYGVGTTEAEAMAAQYAETIRSAVETHGGYLIPSIGTLKKDPNGLIYLDMMARNPVAPTPAPVGKPAETTAPAPPISARPVSASAEPALPEFTAPSEAVVVNASEPEEMGIPEAIPVSKVTIPQSVEPAPGSVGASYRPETNGTRTLVDQLAEQKIQQATLNDLFNREEALPKPAPQTLRKDDEAGQPQPRPTSGNLRINKTARQQAATPASTQRSTASADQSRYPSPRSSATFSSQETLRSSVESAPVRNKRGDLVLILAIIAALIAIAVMVYAQFSVDMPSLDIG